MYKHEIYAELLSCAKIVVILCLLRCRQSQEVDITGVDVGPYPKCHCPCRVVSWVNNCRGEGGWGGDLREMTQRPQGGVSPWITLSTSAMAHKKTPGRAGRACPAVPVPGV